MIDFFTEQAKLEFNAHWNEINVFIFLEGY